MDEQVTKPELGSPVMTVHEKKEAKQDNKPERPRLGVEPGKTPKGD